jgi:hypothetical protein
MSKTSRMSSSSIFLLPVICTSRTAGFSSTTKVTILPPAVSASEMST